MGRQPAIQMRDMNIPPARVQGAGVYTKPVTTATRETNNTAAAVNTTATAVLIHARDARWISAAVFGSRTNATGNSVDMVALPQWTSWISR